MTKLNSLESVLSGFRASVWQENQDTAQLAKDLGLSESNFIKRFWQTNRDFKLSTLIKIAEALGVILEIKICPPKSTQVNPVSASV